ncbi:sensor histidine kinase [Poseidonibacter parvus]|nr:HAMP domain-containing sensor histidine kinase [Poseidonibacter parvus]
METEINLTQSEKRTFIRFFGLYLGGSFILMTIIALLYYQNEKKLYFDLAKTKMQNVVSNISSQIISTHMNGNTLDLKQFLKTDIYKISFFDKDKKKIVGNFDDKIDFNKEIIQHDQHFILVNNSTYGHLGVHYIAIEENLFFKTLKKLKVDILVLFLVIYSIISLMGFFLAKLFLKPIKDERKKLNNFIKDTTHELNTPISAILMSSESNELTKKQVQRIQLAAHRVSEIYKDLTYVFLEDQEEIKELPIILLNQTIPNQLKYFEVLSEKKKIELSCEIEEVDFKIIENDFIRLFNNIVSNAIKYNKAHGKVKIELKNNTLIVTDTGIGIEEKKIKDIFNRYYRATKEQGGFGIGLNIVQNICLKYDIKYNIDSKLNEGTTFSFYFKTT